MSGNRVISVNVAAELRELQRGDEARPTGIWKEPAEGPRAFADDRVEGDLIGNPDAHGGRDKAVYAYAWPDYEWWSTEHGIAPEPGLFGENLTISGPDPMSALVGERWRVGEALLEVSEPREPCWKLARKLGDPGFVRSFAEAMRLGTYLRIIEPGRVGAGDPIAIESRPDHDVTIDLVGRALLVDRALLPELLAAGDALSGPLREAASQAAGR